MLNTPSGFPVLLKHHWNLSRETYDRIVDVSGDIPLLKQDSITLSCINAYQHVMKTLVRKIVIWEPIAKAYDTDGRLKAKCERWAQRVNDMKKRQDAFLFEMWDLVLDDRESIEYVVKRVRDAQVARKTELRDLGFIVHFDHDDKITDIIASSNTVSASIISRINWIRGIYNQDVVVIHQLERLLYGDS